MKHFAGVIAVSACLLLFAGCGFAPKGQAVGKSPQESAKEKRTSTQTNTHVLSDSANYYFSKAEDYYSSGAAIAQESNWDSAQSCYEKALEVLYVMDFDSKDSGQIDRFNRLLREVAHDYRNTLVYLGELSDDSSQTAFLEQFYDWQTFRSQDFATSSDTLSTGEAEELEEEVVTQPAVEAGGIVLEWNDQVERQLYYLTRQIPKQFQDYLARSGKYIPLMVEIIRRNGLPEDLVYLPLIESGFNTKAYSWAHASGPWQFISSTGKTYGMERNWWYDERRDFIKSTQAACDYLKYLYEMFGDWKLALAAYNGGEGRVYRTIKKQRTSDFWRLKLRKQTRDYVPRYMAAVMVAKDPKKYGFQEIYFPPLRFDVVEIDRCLDLKEIARVTGEDINILRELNPELLRDVTPPGQSRYQLRIPAGKKEMFLGAYEDLSSKVNTVFARHRVRRGESWGAIARKYGTTSSALAELNRATTRKRIYAGQYLTVPVAVGGVKDSYEPQSNVQASTPVKSSVPDRNYLAYTVKRHDTLGELADRHGVSVSSIRKLNGFSSRRPLYVGERIRIPGKTGQYSQNAIDRLTENIVIHIVRDGDTLWEIARNYGTNWRDILAWNDISDPESIKPGQKLKIYRQ